VAGSLDRLMRLSTSSRVRRLSMVAFAAGSMLVTLPQLGSAQNSDDPRRERDRVRAERAAEAAKIDGLEADQAEVERVLAQLTADINEQQGEVAQASRELELAVQAVRDAEAAVAAKEREVAQAEVALEALVLQTFVQGASADSLGLSALSGDPNTGLRYGLSQMSTLQLSSTIDGLSAARDDLEVARGEAADAELDASARRDDEASRLTGLEQTEAAQIELAAEIDDRLDRSLAEAAYLAEFDEELSEQIAADDRRLAEEQERARQAQARAAAVRAASSGGGGAVVVPAGTTSSGVGIDRIENVDTAIARKGIRVNVAILDSVNALIDSADADGINLDGSGFRSSAGQIATRRANCGSSDYDIYQKPASACRPPTARPGKSQHEVGLAIDFTCDGALIRSRSSPCFVWLANNAGRFGLRNLPSEPWHWSTTGR
jgi:hypothetical protein